MEGGAWVCIAEGFPSIPFFVNQDISREDGIVQCTHMTTAEALHFGWTFVRALRLLINFGL